MAGEIDLVIPWVDGADPVWQAEHAKYRADSSSDNSSARYRDWDTLRYWFRGIEANAPWVRKVHFVTFGHLPSWLNTEHPKLHIVNHRDYIPEKYLPTFSSHVIELNMHRIPGLAEQFVYFNDDVYLSQPTRAEDFFRDGKPVDSAVFGIIKNNDTANFMPYIMLNMLAVINMRFSKRSMLKRDFSKWFSPKYGKFLLTNLYLSPWGDYTGFRNFHTCVPFRKETFEEVWAAEPEILDATCAHKFRSRADVNQYLMRYWRLAKGEFVPGKPNSDYLTIGSEDMAAVERLLHDPAKKVACINDDPMGFDFDTEQKKLVALFEAKFPEKCSFEL